MKKRVISSILAFLLVFSIMLEPIATLADKVIEINEKEVIKEDINEEKDLDSEKSGEESIKDNFTDEELSENEDDKIEDIKEHENFDHEIKSKDEIKKIDKLENEDTYNNDLDIGEAIYVDQNAEDGGDGSSWTDALKGLDDAIEKQQKSESIETIYVADGEYEIDDYIHSEHNYDEPCSEDCNQLEKTLKLIGKDEDGDRPVLICSELEMAIFRESNDSKELVIKNFEIRSNNEEVRIGVLDGNLRLENLIFDDISVDINNLEANKMVLNDLVIMGALFVNCQEVDNLYINNININIENDMDISEIDILDCKKVNITNIKNIGDLFINLENDYLVSNNSTISDIKNVGELCIEIDGDYQYRHTEDDSDKDSEGEKNRNFTSHILNIENKGDLSLEIENIDECEIENIKLDSKNEFNSDGLSYINLMKVKKLFIKDIYLNVDGESFVEITDVGYITIDGIKGKAVNLELDIIEFEELDLENIDLEIIEDSYDVEDEEDFIDPGYIDIDIYSEICRKDLNINNINLNGNIGMADIEIDINNEYELSNNSDIYLNNISINSDKKFEDNLLRLALDGGSIILDGLDTNMSLCFSDCSYCYNKKNIDCIYECTVYKHSLKNVNIVNGLELEEFNVDFSTNGHMEIENLYIDGINNENRMVNLCCVYNLKNSEIRNVSVLELGYDIFLDKAKIFKDVNFIDGLVIDNLSGEFNINIDDNIKRDMNIKDLEIKNSSLCSGLVTLKICPDNPSRTINFINPKFIKNNKKICGLDDNAKNIHLIDIGDSGQLENINFINMVLAENELYKLFSEDIVEQSNVNVVNSSIFNNEFVDYPEYDWNDSYENKMNINNTIYTNNSYEYDYDPQDDDQTYVFYNNSIVDFMLDEDGIWRDGLGIRGEGVLTPQPGSFIFYDMDGRLILNSPAIDAGNNDHIVDYMKLIDSKDIDGNNRILNEKVDIGAYEYKRKETPVDPEPGPSIDPSLPEVPKEDIKPEEPGKPGIEPELEMDEHFSYLEGYEDATIRPQSHLKREEAAMIFFRILEEDYRDSIRKNDNDFKDVNENRWSNEAVSSLSEIEVILGYDDMTFRPGNNITRAEVATLIARFKKIEPSKDTMFKDIKNHWAESYISSLEEQGWLIGDDGVNYRPDDFMTRAEFTTLINKVLNRKTRVENMLDGRKEFKDLEKDKWYYEDMQEAINGHDFDRMDDGTEKWTKLVQ